MENKNDSEFEDKLPKSSEMTENTKAEEQSVDTINFSHSEENSHAVDATVTMETNDSLDGEEREEEPNDSYQAPEALFPQAMEQTRTISQTDQKYKKKRKVKGLASSLAAGVIGSVLTLLILPHTDYINDHFPKVENQEVINSQQGTQVKTVVAQPTAASVNSIADTVENVSKAIVGIVNYQPQQNNFYGSNSSESVESGSGSGVIFQKNNDTAYIVTNNHVVEGASNLEVSLINGEKATAEVVGTDALTDLAVLKIDAKYVTATADFGDSSSLRPGDQVYAIGNPLGLDLSRTVTQGIVSAINRSIAITTSAGNWDTNVIQTDAAINPGNSGGALINPQGQVIGINSLKISENGVEGLGFAIPSNDLIPIVNQLIKSGKIDRPYLGVGLADLEQVPQMYWQNLPNNTTKGVMLTTVEPNSAAANAGLQEKDIIISMNETEITSSSDLRKYLYTKVSKGDEVKFGVYRDGKQITINVKLAE